MGKFAVEFSVAGSMTACGSGVCYSRRRKDPQSIPVKYASHNSSNVYAKTFC